MNPLLFLRYLLLPALVVTGSLLGEWWNFLVPAICFILHPLYNLIAPEKKLSHDHEPENYSSRAYRLVALLFVPVLIGVTAWALYRATSQNLSPVAFIGIIISTGIMNGVLGFTLAHEFIHRFSKTEKIAGHLLLLQQTYLHYSIEHLGGHHVYACTFKDPHTARFNESFYRFFPRAVLHTFTNAWEIECKRLMKKKFSVMGFRNRMLLFAICEFIFLSLLTIFTGWTGIVFIMSQALVAIGLLHVTNYLQHYGLFRNETDPGHFEKVNEHHAWSAPRAKDGLSLFHLENHADHHMHPNRSYEELSRHEDSPEQPAGYSGMIILALVPPAWFRVMNKRVAAFVGKRQ